MPAHALFSRVWGRVRGDGAPVYGQTIHPDGEERAHPGGIYYWRFQAGVQKAISDISPPTLRQLLSCKRTFRAIDEKKMISTIAIPL